MVWDHANEMSIKRMMVVRNRHQFAVNKMQTMSMKKYNHSYCLMTKLSLHTWRNCFEFILVIYTHIEITSYHQNKHYCVITKLMKMCAMHSAGSTIIHNPPDTFFVQRITGQPSHQCASCTLYYLILLIKLENIREYDVTV